jgi:PadR family transcriptional regulator, regulatory protein AphA
MSTPRLSQTSFIVLGLLEQAGSGTPYDLKRAAEVSTNNFWTVPHTQIYTECARLAEIGLLIEEREQTGRRRRVYRLTDEGRAHLERWRGEPSEGISELRDASTLKLFFGGDPGALAADQLGAHERQLAAYEALIAHKQHLPSGQALALECGIGHEREWVRFWTRVADGAPPADG